MSDEKVPLVTIFPAFSTLRESETMRPLHRLMKLEPTRLTGGMERAGPGKLV